MSLRNDVLKVARDVRPIVAAAVATGNWELIGRNRHYKLRHIPTGRLSVAPTCDSSCPRAAQNFARDIRHIEAGLPGWGVPNVIETEVSLKRKEKPTHIVRGK